MKKKIKILIRLIPLLALSFVFFFVLNNNKAYAYSSSTSDGITTIYNDNLISESGYNWITYNEKNYIQFDFDKTPTLISQGDFYNFEFYFNSASLDEANNNGYWRKLIDFSNTSTILLILQNDNYVVVPFNEYKMFSLQTYTDITDTLTYWYYSSLLISFSELSNDYFVKSICFQVSSVYDLFNSDLTNFVPYFVALDTFESFDYLVNIPWCLSINDEDIFYSGSFLTGKWVSYLDYKNIYDNYQNSSNYSDGFDDGVEITTKDFNNKIVELNSQISNLENTIASLNAQIKTLSDDKYTFTSLLWGVAQTPLGVLSQILNLNVLGVNLFGILTGLLSAMLLIWLIKKFMR